MTGAHRRGRTLIWSLLLAAALTSARAEAELIGLWDLEAPETAELLSGGTSVFFDWLHVSNSPVNIAEAFTGYGILDDGYANFSRDTVVELGYREGAVRNRPGADLVLLSRDFQFDAFALSTSLDGFQSEFLLGGSGFVLTGPARHYYYGGAPGLYEFFVYAVPFDLSLLGVPDDESVVGIRVRGTIDDGGDLIGVGAIREAAEPSSLVLLLVGAALAIARAKGAPNRAGARPSSPAPARRSRSR